jgi:hypothetical protein
MNYGKNEIKRKTSRRRNKGRGVDFVAREREHQMFFFFFSLHGVMIYKARTN